jgi:hypothetical protein
VLLGRGGGEGDLRDSSWLSGGTVADFWEQVSLSFSLFLSVARALSRSHSRFLSLVRVRACSLSLSL